MKNITLLLALIMIGALLWSCDNDTTGPTDQTKVFVVPTDTTAYYHQIWKDSGYVKWEKELIVVDDETFYGVNYDAYYYFKLNFSQFETHTFNISKMGETATIHPVVQDDHNIIDLGDMKFGDYIQFQATTNYTRSCIIYCYKQYCGPSYGYYKAILEVWTKFIG